MNQRFQRAALIAEAARLESYINQQLDLTYRITQELPADVPSQFAHKLMHRYQRLGECREVANSLRQLLWNLE